MSIMAYLFQTVPKFWGRGGGKSFMFNILRTKFKAIPSGLQFPHL